MRADQLQQGLKLGGRWTRPSLACAALFVLFVLLDPMILRVSVPGADWAPLWVAGELAWTNPVAAYDFDLVSSLQRPLVGATSVRPFVYPPSALLLFTPLALLPFTASFLLVMLGSLALLARAAQPLGTRLSLLLVAPPVVLAAIAGQPTLLVAALILFGLSQLDRNQWWAGLLFGVAAMIKPPLVLLAPIALAGGGYWRALAASGTSAVIIAATSLAIFGLDAWLAWLAAVPQFKTLVTDFAPLLRNAVTPYAMAVRIGLVPEIVTVCAALVAIPVVWMSFARTSDTAVRLVALVGGALLVSPYAMNYELAALAPAVAALPIRKPKEVIIPAIWAIGLFVTVSLLGLLAAYGWALARLVSQGNTRGGVPRPHRAETRRA